MGVFRRFLQKAQTKLIKFSFLAILPHKALPLKKRNYVDIFSWPKNPASLIVPDSVQKANLAEAVNKIVNMDFSTLFGSLIRESLWILVKVLIALSHLFHRTLARAPLPAADRRGHAAPQCRHFAAFVHA